MRSYLRFLRAALILPLMLPIFAGCSSQQKVEASNAAQKAKTDIEQATAKAKHDLTDGGITLKVKTAMSQSDKLNTSDINVDTKDKVLTIKGSVASEEQRERAERIANDIVGTDVTVVNQLQVRPPAPSNSAPGK
jgi:hyperosmotically inducible periplasmic protein